MNLVQLCVISSADHKLLSNYNLIKINTNNTPVNHTRLYILTNEAIPCVIYGAPNRWKPSAAPEDWKPQQRNVTHNKHTFKMWAIQGSETVIYIYPKFEDKYNNGPYSHYPMPT